jgi:hypothetical protein
MKSSLLLIHTLYVSLPKFCVNCVHYIPHKKPEFSECKLFPLGNDDTYLITGQVNIQPIEYHYCSTSRIFDHMCGKSGEKYKEFTNNIPE